MNKPSEFFKVGTLYESILCSKYVGSDWINSACMGFRLLDEEYIIVTPYFNTDTINNLVEGKKFSINLIEDPKFYVKASLYGWNKGAFGVEFDNEYFTFEKSFPLLKNSNISMICEVESIGPYNKNDINLGNCIKSKIIETKFNSIPRVYFNREFSLILESLISATRAKIAKDKGNDPEKQMYYSLISENFIKLRRFSEDKDILESIGLIKEWILESIDNEFETQWDYIKQ